LTDRIARIQGLITRHCVQNVTCVVVLLPCSCAMSTHAGTITRAREVLAVEVLYQDFALAADKVVVLVGP